MTKTRLSIFILIGFLLGLAAPAWAGYQEGIDAYKRGDYDTAMTEWRSLAEQGDAEAQWFLGSMYYQGEGVPQDDQEAVRWYRQAADQGDAYAQNTLGYMYHDGKGVQKDSIQAYMWWVLSAEQGFRLAKESLETVEKKMTPAQLAVAQRLARERKAKGSE